MPLVPQARLAQEAREREVREKGRGRKEEKGRSRKEERGEGDKGRSCRLCLTACASVLACGPLGHLAPQISTWVTRLSDSGGTVTKLKFAWGHIELLQEVLSISRMHLTEGDIP